MKLSFYIYKLLFFAVLLGTVQNSYGQIPPYEYSTKMIDEKIGMYYEREDIPFYSIFNYSFMHDYGLEVYLKNFNYRSYNSFTAPKRVKKLTYYLGNNLVDSVRNAKHEFFFSKKTHLLEKEIKYQNNMLSSISADTVNMEQYIYQYKEDKEHFIVKKLLQSKDSLVLLQKYIYSKDKNRLLETEFLSRDYQWSLIRREYPKSPTTKHVIFCYNKNKILESAFYTDNTTTLSDFGSYVDNFNEYAENEDKWKKSYWIELMGITSKDMKKINFPKKLNFKCNIDVFIYNHILNKEKSYSPNESYEQRSSLMNSENIFDLEYTEYLRRQRDHSRKYGDYKRYTLLLFDKNKRLSIGQIDQSYSSLIDNNGIRFQDQTPFNRILITSFIDNKNTYIINKTAGDYNAKFLIEIKPKDDLNEIYIIKNKQKHPLITIN